LSSHDPGSIGCQLSIGYGARMIEKHVKLKTEVWNHFDVVALSLDDRTFSNFCADIRLAEKYAGRKYKEITKSEHHKYEPQK
jgi:sialic acid synthase SpsE